MFAVSSEVNLRSHGKRYCRVSVVGIQLFYKVVKFFCLLLDSTVNVLFFLCEDFSSLLSRIIGPIFAAWQEIASFTLPLMK